MDTDEHGCFERSEPARLRAASAVLPIPKTGGSVKKNRGKNKATGQPTQMAVDEIGESLIQESEIFELRIQDTEFGDTFIFWDTIIDLFGYEISAKIADDVKNVSDDDILIFVGGYDDCERTGNLLKEKSGFNFTVSLIDL